MLEKIFKLLAKKFPDAKCGLNFETPFQLLIATILSAQVTDKKVNEVTAILFDKYPTSKKLAMAPLNDLIDIIRPLGLYKNKSKHIKESAAKLIDKEVPKSVLELVKLPGVGKKTANVVLGNAYNIASGIAVDTHVKRVSFRLGLTKFKDPLKIERDLMKGISKNKWIMLSHYMIALGRTICTRVPICSNCPLNTMCKYFSECT